MKHFELKMPKFLLAEEPKEGYDSLSYIYSPHYLSLILIIPEDDLTVLLNEGNRQRPRKTFTYEFEPFEFVILQNNVLATGGGLSPEISEEEFLIQAWEWYENYLIWEDNNIDNEMF